MATAAERASRFVADAFPGALLPPPVLGGFPFVRFDLGGDLPPFYRPFRRFRGFDLPGRLSRTRPRVEPAVVRAAALFEVAIPPGNRGFFDAYMTPPGDEWLEPGAEENLIQLLPKTARSP